MNENYPIPNRSTRHGCLVAVIGTFGIASIIWLIHYLSDVDLSSYLWWWYIFLGASNIVFLYALLKWKKWGFWGILGTSLISSIIFLFVTLIYAHSGVGISVGILIFILVGLLFIALQMGGSHKAWNKLKWISRFKLVVNYYVWAILTHEHGTAGIRVD